jgi:acetyl esterase/lipase
MRRSPLLLVAALALSCVVPAAAIAKVRTGPSGVAFYKPPSKLPGRVHGDVVWTRSLKGGAALTAASSNALVLYRSTGSDGKPIAVSGSVALPRGRAPRGGWPVVTYAHGTSGIADECAPSRDNGSNAAHAYSSYSYPLMNRWLKRGYAVVRTDYQGLGTPGVHEYLGGVSEGRSTLDIVRAARQLDPRVGKRFVITGHSQGGHAALWAASLARRWTPDLTLRGTVAFAPASHLGEQSPLARSLTQPAGGLGALIAMIIRGADEVDPSVNVRGLLTEKAAALYPQLDQKCLVELGRADSFGGLPPSELFRSDADIGPVVAVIQRNDPEDLRIAGAPVRIEQGSADSTVQPGFTDQLDAALRDRGAKVTYRKYDGVDHVGIVTAAAPDATRFIDSRLR